jgi:hypothetical protein
MSAGAGLGTEKLCPKCKVTQPITEFSKDKQTKSGISSHCKPCKRRYSLRYRYANLEKVQAQHREYHRNNWAKNQENLKRTKAKHPEREMARVLLHRALRKGWLTKQPCEKCGDPKGQAHHEDYSKPLEVHWMCHKCHGKEHRTSPEGLAALEDCAAGENGKLAFTGSREVCR